MNKLKLALKWHYFIALPMSSCHSSVQ